jgi:hypothetical protein
MKLRLKDTNVKPLQPSAALLITALNCETVIGIRWRTARKYAAKLGVPIVSVGDKKLAIPAQAFLAALLSSEQPPANANDITDHTDDGERARMRAELGFETVRNRE